MGLVMGCWNGQHIQEYHIYMFYIFLVVLMSFLDSSESKTLTASPEQNMHDQNIMKMLKVNHEGDSSIIRKRSFASFRFRPTENLEMINRAYELMRNINEIVGENTNYDEALRAQAKLRAKSLMSRIEVQQPYEFVLLDDDHV